MELLCLAANFTGRGKPRRGLSVAQAALVEDQNTGDALRELCLRFM
jgi:hypothetical protein